MTPLQQKTYELLKKVPAGKVTTYKALADALGTKAYRAIGQFMRTNPDAPNTPCHRVVASNGSLGGFMGKTNGKEIRNKVKMLGEEGIKVRNNRIINFKAVVFKFPTSA